MAKPVLEMDSHAKVQMRKKVRGLRQIEQAVLKEQGAEESRPLTDADPGTPTTVETAPALETASAAADSAGRVVLDYRAAVRGILNDDQGGPLSPPGLRMAEALSVVRESLQRNLDEKKGGSQKSNLADWPGVSIGASTRFVRDKERSASTSRRSRKSPRPSTPAKGAARIGGRRSKD